MERGERDREGRERGSEIERVGKEGERDGGAKEEVGS